MSLLNPRLLAVFGTGSVSVGAWAYFTQQDEPVKKRLLVPYKDEAAKFGSDYTIVLDMDETLLHTSFTGAGGGRVSVRPHAAELVKSVSQMSEMILWTAGTEEYAIQALKLIGPEEKLFHHRIYRNSLWFNAMTHIKSLRRLNRDLDRTIIIDNSPAAVDPADRRHAIVVTDYFSDANDKELIDVQRLLKELTSSGLTVPNFLEKKIVSGELIEGPHGLVYMPPQRTGFFW